MTFISNVLINKAKFKMRQTFPNSITKLYYTSKAPNPNPEVLHCLNESNPISSILTVLSIAAIKFIQMTCICDQFICQFIT